jgi:ubiquinone/menaquinone biosynthesis C-methylase UbiE
MSSVHQGFQETGQSAAGTEAAFRWLDSADGHPLVQEIKKRLLEIRPVGAADEVLDVGCGLGHEVRRLAELAGPMGRVVGIDANPVMIDEARRRAEGATMPITFHVADAHAIAFPDDTFDLCRTERVLRYVERPDVVLAEMVRMTQPGGSVLAFDFDSDQTVVDAPDQVLARKIALALDAAVPHPWIGRQLFGLFHRVGLHGVRVVPHAMCISGQAGFAAYQQLNRGTIDQAVQVGRISASEAGAWWVAMERAAEAGTFCSATLGFIAVGYKA